MVIIVEIVAPVENCPRVRGSVMVNIVRVKSSKVRGKVIDKESRE